MTAQDNENFEMPAKDQAAAPEPSVGGKAAIRKQQLLTSFSLSLMIALLLCAGNWWIDEKSDFGKRVEEMTYGMLQHYLSPGGKAKDPHIVVLDISTIRMVPSMGFHEENITDRKSLQKVVEILANVNPRPLGIGLDVDFSPDARGYADPYDKTLFDSFLKLETQRSIPIRVGIHRSVDLEPGRWLVDPTYASLAACVVVPNSTEGHSTWYMPEWIDVVYSAEIYEGITQRCPMLGITLAQLAVLDSAQWSKWLLASTRQRSFQADPEHGTRLVSNEILVDYSPLDVLVPAPEVHLSDDRKRLEITQRKGKDVQSESPGMPVDISKLVGGNIVFLGRAKDTTDTFTVPGRPDKPYAGVYLHACAAYTLLGATLYTLAGPVRLLADLLLSVAIFGILFWVRLRNRNELREQFFERRLPVLLAVGVAAVILLCETWLLPHVRLMWDDFLLVVFVLLVHSPIERAADRFTEWCRGSIRMRPQVSTPSSSPPSEGK